MIFKSSYRKADTNTKCYSSYDLYLTDGQIQDIIWQHLHFLLGDQETVEVIFFQYDLFQSFLVNAMNSRNTLNFRDNNINLLFSEFPFLVSEL